MVTLPRSWPAELLNHHFFPGARLSALPLSLVPRCMWNVGGTFAVTEPLRACSTSPNTLVSCPKLGRETTVQGSYRSFKNIQIFLFSLLFFTRLAKGAAMCARFIPAMLVFSMQGASLWLAASSVLTSHLHALRGKKYPRLTSKELFF